MTRLLDDWVTQQASRRPAQVAVSLERGSLTYAQLEDWSNRLANTLQAVHVRNGDRVGLLLPKGPLSVAAVVGTLKAGAVYVPLDLDSAARRLAPIISSSQPSVILTDAQGARLLDEIYARGQVQPPPPVGWLDVALPPVSDGPTFSVLFTLGDVEEQSAKTAAPRRPRADTDAAYLMYTAGSEGTPRGVVITHRSACHFVEWAAQYFATSPEDRHSGHAPLHLDLSVYDMFGTFAAGAQLCLVPSRLNLFPAQLAEFIRAAALTQWFSTPGILNTLAKFDVLRFHDFPLLRRVLWWGEVLPTPSLLYWMRRLPHVTFTNLYGASETTVASAYYTLPTLPSDERSPVPIGRPCPGAELLVLDDHLRPVSHGAIGELYIGGVGLSPGYWRDEENTQAVFLSHPARSGERVFRTGDLGRVGPDGLYHFMGRRGAQVTTHGHRVELGEVEAALHVIHGIQDCAVVSVSMEGSEDVVICCAYAVRPGVELTAAKLRSQLATMLPAYLLPTQWLAFGALPRSPNGMIDYRRLQELFAEEAVKR